MCPPNKVGAPRHLSNVSPKLRLNLITSTLVGLASGFRIEGSSASKGLMVVLGVASPATGALSSSIWGDVGGIQATLVVLYYLLQR